MALRILIIIVISAFSLSAEAQKAMHSKSKTYVIRLKPHEDLKKSIMQFAKDNNIKAGIVQTCVGSLEQYNLRFANQENGSLQNGHFEIVSCVGTFSSTACHLHLAVSDSLGVTRGGHLLENNLVYTTIEIALAELTDIVFERIIDPTYGYSELNVVPEKK
jgi:predicted DNA-binding protein with PD1-like motif